MSARVQHHDPFHMAALGKLYGGEPRRRQPIATLTQPSRLLALTGRTDGAHTVIETGGVQLEIVFTAPDDPRLNALTAGERGLVHSLLSTQQRGGHANG